MAEISTELEERQKKCAAALTSPGCKLLVPVQNSNYVRFLVLLQIKVNMEVVMIQMMMMKVMEVMLMKVVTVKVMALKLVAKL